MHMVSMGLMGSRIDTSGQLTSLLKEIAIINSQDKSAS